MKIMTVGNAPWVGTGYGTQINLLTKSLMAAGHDVAHTANYGLQGAKMEWGGMTVYPAGYDMWGNDVIDGNTKAHFDGDRGWVITLFDVWVARGPAWQTLDVASWCPVDHLPIPSKVLGYFQDTSAVPIAMSEWGRGLMEKAGLNPHYAPHGIDTDIFKPGDFEVGGMTAREAFGIPADAFVVGVNAANKGRIKIRKSFPQIFAAFAMFAKDHDDAVLFMHTERHGMADGIRLDDLAETCGVPKDKIIYVDQYAYKMGLSSELMAAMYNTFDVLCAPSLGEGFGIPVIEAQACGVPVIVNNFSAQPELVGSGWMVEGTADWEEAQQSWLQIPRIGDIVDALREAYMGKGDATAARTKALDYDQNIVFHKYWGPILADLHRRHNVPTVDVKPIDVSAL